MVQEIVVICGPTAAGKTQIGIELAKKFDGEIISADSQQVWKGFDIGTAKADLSDRKAVRHHLIDIVGPGDHFDAASFVKYADSAIADIRKRKNRVFVVGGTGLYIKMLLCGICDAPPQDAQYRRELCRMIEEKGVNFLHEMLSKVDLEGASSLHPNDKTRIIRALEIFHITGKSSSNFYREHNFKNGRYDALKIGINCDRETLYRRIDERVDRMFKEGLVEEVKSLLKIYSEDAQPFLAVGYKEVLSHVKGEIDLDRAIYLTKRNSRHFAKRQLTWFRADDEIKWFIHTPKLKDIVHRYLAERLQSSC